MQCWYFGNYPGVMNRAAGRLVMERVMLGLRTSAGLPEAYVKEHCDCTQVDEALRCGNLIQVDGGIIRIPENRFFISDSIISSII